MGLTTTRYEAIIRAMDPISHSEGTIGNDAIFMRTKVLDQQCREVMVPYITGNALRHQVREAAVYCTLDAAGLLDDPQLSRGALRLLFRGGMLTKRGDGSVINIDRYRELVALFPPLAILGGCIDNRSVPGQLIVDEAMVLCLETQHLWPAWAADWVRQNKIQTPHEADCMEKVQRVGMDPELQPEKLNLLTSGERVAAWGKQLAREDAHEQADSKLAKESKSDMMPYSFERLARGTLFWWGIECRTYSDLEFDAFNYSVGCLLNNFRIGGKRATGHGRLEFVAGCRIHFRPQAGDLENVDKTLAPKCGDLYKRHVRERADELKAWLTREVNA
jgi:hypothetical protein